MNRQPWQVWGVDLGEKESTFLMAFSDKQDAENARTQLVAEGLKDVEVRNANQTPKGRGSRWGDGGILPTDKEGLRAYILRTIDSALVHTWIISGNDRKLLEAQRRFYEGAEADDCLTKLLAHLAAVNK